MLTVLFLLKFKNPKSLAKINGKKNQVKLQFTDTISISPIGLSKMQTFIDTVQVAVSVTEWEMKFLKTEACRFDSNVTRQLLAMNNQTQWIWLCQT